MVGKRSKNNRPRLFALNPSDYGIPDIRQLEDYRIWDTHYHGFNRPIGGRDPIKQHHEMMFYMERMGIERVISLDIGRNYTDGPPLSKDKLCSFLEEAKDKMSSNIIVDPGFPEESCAKMEEWIRKGPCIGIKNAGGNELGVTCNDPKNDATIRLADELGAVIYIHTWTKVGGSPRYPGGNNNPGESTPMDVAILAQRFPNVPLICGHAGGDWELAARAIRPHENVFFEFAGSDPHSGSVDYAVNQLGVDRIVWGGHGPSRSYSTELSKVLDASISHSDRMKIFGGNYRRIAERIFRNKGIPLEI